MRKATLVLGVLFLFVTLAGCIPVRDSNLIDPNNPNSGQSGDVIVDRDGLLQVIVFTEEWGNITQALFAQFEKHNWFGALDLVVFGKATTKTLDNAVKFISKYEATDFPEENYTVKDEVISTTTEMIQTLQDLDTAIIQNDRKTILSMKPIFTGFREIVQAHQIYYTDYLNERVHLLPETHYPPVAKEYYTAIHRLEGMDWIHNYISVRDSEGRQAFSLEKLKGHAEQVLPEFEKLYNEHRFFNVPQKWGGNNYTRIIHRSLYYINSLKELVDAIENNDNDKIDYCLDGIKLMRINLSSDIRPFI